MLTGSQTGKRVYAMSHDVKTVLKKSLLPGSTVFENMGFTYMGPVDGHDVEILTQMLVLARDMRRPVLLHVHTVKGKGYPYAQQEPGKYHGVGPFDVETGKPLKSSGRAFPPCSAMSCWTWPKRTTGSAPLPPPWWTARG